MQTNSPTVQEAIELLLTLEKKLELRKQSYLSAVGISAGEEPEGVTAMLVNNTPNTMTYREELRNMADTIYNEMAAIALETIMTHNALEGSDHE